MTYGALEKPQPLRPLLAMLPQLSRYSCASVAALALDFSVFLTLTAAATHPAVAGAVGYGAGLILHYLLSVTFVFDTRATDKVHARLFGEFALSGLAGLGVTTLVISLATAGVGLAALPAKVLAAGASFGIVFALRRGFVFAKAGVSDASVIFERTLQLMAALTVDRSTHVQQTSAKILIDELVHTAPPMRAAWLVTFALGASVPLLAPFAGLSIAWGEFWTLPALAIAIGVSGFLLRAQQTWRRLGEIAEVVAVLGLISVFVPLLTCILARTNLPLADQHLAAWDAAFGLDWRKLVFLLKERETPSMVLSYAYASLMQQPTILVLVLGMAGLTRRLQQFALAWVTTLALTALIFPLAPALGGFLYYGYASTDFPFIKVHAAWLHATVLEPLRAGTMNELGAVALEGIVTFPSFHTSAAVLLAWGFWGLRLVRWPALAVNALMILACPIVGGHYFVDVIAGGLLAFGCIILARSVDVADAMRPRAAWLPQ